MECPGEYLKREREIRGGSLEEISKEINVSVKLLRALEADDYANLPHHAFVKGYIKAYCKSLGIDENDAVLRYEHYLQEVAEFDREAGPPVEAEKEPIVIRTPLSNRTVASVAVVAAFIIFIGVFYLYPRSESGGDPGSKAAGEVGVKVATEQDAEVGKEAVKDAAKEAPSVAAPAVKTEVKADRPASIAKKTKAKKTKAVMNNAARRHTLIARATELTWVKIKIDDGKEREVLLKPGELVRWQAKEVFFCS